MNASLVRQARSKVHYGSSRPQLKALEVSFRTKEGPLLESFYRTNYEHLSFSRCIVASYLSTVNPRNASCSFQNLPVMAPVTASLNSKILAGQTKPGNIVINKFNIGSSIILGPVPSHQIRQPADVPAVQKHLFYPILGIERSGKKFQLLGRESVKFWSQLLLLDVSSTTLLGRPLLT
jgi:hypothetical protein